LGRQRIAVAEENLEHQLHIEIGNIIKTLELPNMEVITDPACDGEQHIPLFVESIKSRKTQYCNVDVLVIMNDLVRVIVEIEESDVKPTQVCGKFLTSALSNYYIHKNKKNKEIPIIDALFLQILSSSKLSIGSSKQYQWKNLEKSIQDIIPLQKSEIIEYRLVFEDPEYLHQTINDEVLSIIKTFLSK
jgi:hypothetical protein